MFCIMNLLTMTISCTCKFIVFSQYVGRCPKMPARCPAHQSHRAYTLLPSLSNHQSQTLFAFIFQQRRAYGKLVSECLA